MQPYKTEQFHTTLPKMNTDKAKSILQDIFDRHIYVMDDSMNDIWSDMCNSFNIYIKGGDDFDDDGDTVAIRLLNDKIIHVDNDDLDLVRGIQDCLKQVIDKTLSDGKHSTSDKNANVTLDALNALSLLTKDTHTADHRRGYNKMYKRLLWVVQVKKLPITVGALRNIDPLTILYPTD